MVASQHLAAMALFYTAWARPVGLKKSALYADEVQAVAPDVYANGLDSVPIDALGLSAPSAWRGFPTKGKGKRQTDHDKAVDISTRYPGIVPEGVNPKNCTLKAGQLPVVLIPGTWAAVYDSWAYMGPELADDGYCLYSFNHNPPDKSDVDERLMFVGAIEDSATALSKFVDQVLELTGSDKVDLVGQSQGGGALPQFYLKNLGGAKKVRKMIGIVPSLGTNGNGIVEKAGALANRVLFGWSGLTESLSSLQAGGIGPSEQLWNSEFMKDLHRGGLGAPGVEFVNIATKADNVLIPYKRCLFNGTKDMKVTNVVLQDFCPEDYSNHVGMAYSPNTLTLVRNHLHGIQYDKIVCQKPPKGATDRPDVYPVDDSEPDYSEYDDYPGV